MAFADVAPHERLPTVRSPHGGRPAALRAYDRLSQRQREVMALLAYGLCNKAVAVRLNISEPTVKAYVSAIMRAFGCTNRTQAALISLSLREGLDIKFG